MVVISPHLDDAVFGCGQMLAAHPGSTVVTVFAGMPADAEQVAEWDVRCGFENAREAVTGRRDEDRKALALLGARPLWLDFTDSQYGPAPSVDDIATVLRAVLRAFVGHRVLYPLGLFHSDHRLVHEASAAALTEHPNDQVLVYEDALYRALPRLLQARLAELLQRGIAATPIPIAMKTDATDAGRKTRAVSAYASQLRAFGPGGYADVEQPERCWRLESIVEGAAG